MDQLNEFLDPNKPFFSHTILSLCPYNPKRLNQHLFTNPQSFLPPSTPPSPISTGAPIPDLQSPIPTTQFQTQNRVHPNPKIYPNHTQNIFFQIRQKPNHQEQIQTPNHQNIKPKRGTLGHKENKMKKKEGNLKLKIRVERTATTISGDIASNHPVDSDVDYTSLSWWGLNQENKDWRERRMRVVGLCGGWEDRLEADNSRYHGGPP